MNPGKALLALDIGEKRIGVAIMDGIVRIARPLETISVDGTEAERIAALVEHEQVESVVAGYPRNQAGDPTKQTVFVETFCDRLRQLIDQPIVFQDESLTSVLAEERLKSYGKPYLKSDIDAQAAVIILEDYVEGR